MHRLDVMRVHAIHFIHDACEKAALIDVEHALADSVRQFWDDNCSDHKVGNAIQRRVLGRDCQLGRLL
jgi:hypothetical protein